MSDIYHLISDNIWALSTFLPTAYYAMYMHVYMYTIDICVRIINSGISFTVLGVHFLISTQDTLALLGVTPSTLQVVRTCI